MKRLRSENINTPEHFDEVWRVGESLYNWQTARLEAFGRLISPLQKVLDVGCGLFGWGEWLIKKYPGQAEVHGLDFSPKCGELLAKRSPNLVFHLGECCKMPFANMSFDMTGAGELIEHMEDPAALIAEMARVTRVGGIVVVGTVDPDCPDSIRNGCTYPEHLWQYTTSDLEGFLRQHCTDVVYWRVGNYDFVRGRRA